MLKKFLERLFNSAMDLNRQNILDSVPVRAGGRLLDIGCDDGKWTKDLGQKMQTDSLFGIEIVPERALLAKERGIQVTVADLGHGLPFADNEFDLIHANQVIEHVSDVDLFAKEIYRVLAPGGRVIISTENASSWHNIFALLFGWQMFSLTNLSHEQLGIGNPLALHRGSKGHMKSWTHKVIFSYRGLKEFFLVHQFKDIFLLGAGYYPLASFVGKFDKRHAHFLTLVARK